ncbi:hypothetical protein PoB_005946500 [Plakobranchus ocellatus]|uniref:Uncharacterized protein n=1 Tax=Plakobranchus ocellatus TaxID=259542 RepID=A0AAV4CLQ8_9GAST|nr:hypothetical protein PoB_005946500 [Plakobranchus ocellatus]
MGNSNNSYSPNKKDVDLEKEKEEGEEEKRLMKTNDENNQEQSQRDQTAPRVRNGKTGGSSNTEARPQKDGRLKRRRKPSEDSEVS